MKLKSRLRLALLLAGMVVLGTLLFQPVATTHKRHAQRMHTVNNIVAPYPPLIIALTNLTTANYPQR